MAVKRYWFYLESHVYIAVKENGLLLYNLVTGRLLLYVDQPQLIDFILDLKREENLYALEVSEEYLRKNELISFVDNLREHFMGDMVDVSLSKKKPFFMPPIFDIQSKDSKLGRRTYRNVSKDSIMSIDELTFFVTGNCDESCTECSTAFKQFLWCTRENEKNELELEDIKIVLDETRGGRIKKINIVGGDLNKYSRLDELIGLLNSKPVRINYFIHFLHFRNNSIEKLKRIGPESNICLLMECSTLKYPDYIKYLKELKSGRFKFIFLIRHEQDFLNLEKVIGELKVNEFSVQPYYNNKNLDFFRENVFSDQESLSETSLDINAIKARQSYNTLKYGKMYIKSDKRIYSDLNASPLGVVNNISVAEAVVSELKEQGNWLRVRRNVVPCKDCLLDAICPPLSGYEYAIGINNTCNLWNQNSS